MLATRPARAHAKLGNRTESLTALNEAQEAYRRAGSADKPLWISYVDEIEVNTQSGACYLYLGMYARAEAALLRAIALLKARHMERIAEFNAVLASVNTGPAGDFREWFALYTRSC